MRFNLILLKNIYRKKKWINLINKINKIERKEGEGRRWLKIKFDNNIKYMSRKKLMKKKEKIF